jgi:hypothetical protein
MEIDSGPRIRSIEVLFGVDSKESLSRDRQDKRRDDAEDKMK